MATVSFSEATKAFRGGTVALDRLTLEIRGGEFMVLVGPSGCGKTTALRLLAGLEHVTGGEVRIGDRVVNDLHPRERDIAMVFQNYALYPHMTVRRNIAFSLKVRKLARDEIDRRVEDAARILGLSELLERKPAQLSGGQRQRVAMGRAIVRHPQAFLMDEPLSNLDAKLRVQMRGEITRIQHELEATTVYVTHDQVEAMTMGDRVAVLRKGVLQQVAPPQELFEHPVNLFVASFIGSPEMNLVQATLEQNGAGFACRVGDQELAVPAAVAAARPALAGYVGRTIGVGVRPEHLEDAALQAGEQAGTRLRGRVTATELLGSELLAHVEIQAPPVVTQEVLEVAGDVDSARVHDLEAEARASRSVLVGRFDTASRLRAGDPVVVSVNTARLHFFDLETELAIPAEDTGAGTG